MYKPSFRKETVSQLMLGRVRRNKQNSHARPGSAQKSKVNEYKESNMT